MPNSDEPFDKLIAESTLRLTDTMLQAGVMLARRTDVDPLTRLLFTALVDMSALLTLIGQQAIKKLQELDAPRSVH